jgi:hypothetical protein
MIDNFGAWASWDLAHKSDLWETQTPVVFGGSTPGFCENPLEFEAVLKFIKDTAWNLIQLSIEKKTAFLILKLI